MTITTAGPTTVAEQITANEAHIEACIEACIAAGQTDPIDTAKTVEVLGDDGGTITVVAEVVDVDAFRRCDACGRYAADGINGRDNCRGFYCDDDDLPNACHADCYA